MMRFLLLLTVFLPQLAFAGINGVVKDSGTKEPLYGCVVSVKTASGRSIAFTTTDFDGRFSIEKDTSAGDSLEVKQMGYSRVVLALKAVKSPVEILLTEESFHLKEVSVKADRIREQGDTITYLVSSFAQKNDRTIGDVLARMPGIDVEKSGKIKYQGVDINKFYIEGQDLLGSKYGVATNGVSHEDIGVVEVMEQHQPMQVLQGLTMSQQAAINLKLKDGKKSAWLVHGSLGGGFSDEKGLWNGEIFTLATMPESQTLITAKTNNTGYGVSSSLTEFNAAKRKTEVENPYHITLSSIPSLPQERTRFNQTALFSYNNLWDLKKGRQLKVNVDYMHNRLENSAQTVTTYFLESGDKEVTEIREDESKANMLRLNLTTEINKKTHFLNNSLKIQFDWSETTLNTSGTYYNAQSLKAPDFYLNNSLKLIRRIGKKHLVTINSVNEWESLPAELTVRKGADIMGQKLRNHAFYTDESASYSFHIGEWSVGVEGGLQGLLRTFTGTWSNARHENPDGCLDIFALKAVPKLEYNLPWLNIKLDCPLSLQHVHAPSTDIDKQQMLYSPTFTFLWKANHNLSLNLTAATGNNMLPISGIFSGLILSEHRVYRKGYSELLLTGHNRLSSRMTYRNVRKGLFGNLSVMKVWNKSPYRSAQSFQGNDIFYTYEKADTHSESFNTMGSVNKTLDFMRGGTGLNAMFTRNSRLMLSEKSITEYTTDNLSLGASLNGYALQNLFFQYDFTLSQVWLRINATQQKSLTSTAHSFKLVYTPTDPLTLELKNDIYNNEISAGTRKVVEMLDAKCTVRLTKTLELVATATNLFNKKAYTYTTYGLLNQTTHLRHLRGREILISSSFGSS